jgi:hypothetical protein
LCRNLLTTADDDLLGAAGDVNEAALIEVADLAGAQSGVLVNGSKVSCGRLP